ncbi:hypothetical protein HDU87_007053 [Geranomyces variabilis]|uniref:Uncharacterized protein n=1 Tax=Geranomyces variabilis TaxID=109894 RepID=A0AAD5TG32_9FUNG|nr:hypothetical protein HDU87_007053 [Geranomyces variabilis]
MEQSLTPLIATIHKCNQDLDFLAAQLAEAFPTTLENASQQQQQQQRRSSGRTSSKRPKQIMDPTDLLRRLNTLETDVRDLKSEAATVVEAKEMFAREASAAVATNAALLAQLRQEASLAEVEDDEETAGSVQLFSKLAATFTSTPGR